MPNDPWSLHLKVLKYSLEALPVITVPLAPPIEALQECTQGAVKELLEARAVPVHSVVVVIPSEFAVQRSRAPRAAQPYPFTLRRIRSRAAVGLYAVC